MGQVISSILPEAVGVAISPVPIIAVVLLLATPRGKGNGLALLLGWLVGLAAVGTIVLLLADPAEAAGDDGPADWVGWFILILGVLAVLGGLGQYRNRPRGDDEPAMPKWMSTVDKFTPGRSAAIGLALAAINPKNLTLTLAAAAAIAGAGLDTGESYLTLAIFVIIGTIGLAIPIGIYFLGGDKASETLNDLRHWLAVHNPAIMTVLFIVIGMKLIGSGLQTILT